MTAIPSLEERAALRDAYWSSAVATPSTARRHVTVIGAGIVGLSTAAALVRSGHRVTVVDAAARAGQGASFGNGCQLSYGYVAPLAHPDLFAELPRLLLAKGAPLRLIPRLDPAQWQWMLQFLSCCSSARAARNSLELLQLGNLSRVETDLWLQGSDTEALGFARSGKLVVLPTQKSLSRAIAQMRVQAIGGPPQRALNETEALHLEPALASFADRMAGAIHTPSECAIDSLALCDDLVRRLAQRGVEFQFDARVTGAASHGPQRGNRITRLRTTAGEREVDTVVLAAGTGSAAVARLLGFVVPVYPLKGYSITVPIVDPERVPKISVTDAARKVVYARIGRMLRVAGVAEIGGNDLRIEQTRIDQLVSHTREAFGDAVDLSSVSAWTGLRPATPSSVPLIGQSRIANVFVNVGHGALGLTLAFGSARRLAEQMVARASP